ncbi:alpha/beta-hydrolase [Ophiobolus disseminans]|uniref:Alpha/beta-hydrolase n=1 Tax=Ophiobolus disseminans TaxID=1469910 RepID=A0A6A6ZGP5_9PLEO|nr:alpha/beta-hydrolase [Ophiobolus disseminans]
MHFYYSIPILTIVASLALAQDCPPGYEIPEFSWRNCPVEKVPTLQCSTLEVPLDYSKPSGDTLNLRLVRVPASSTSPRNRSIIYNPGGPVSAIKLLLHSGWSRERQLLVGNDFHIVTFDPRGTGLSIPFECPSSNNSRFLKDTDSDLQHLFDEYSLQADTCAQTKYKDINALIGTAYVARDVKAIAGALGEDGLIRYLGYSFGTLIGATTAAMFPASIDRMVLDANMNPTDYYYGLGAEAYRDVDNAVAHFFDLCAEAGPSNCVVGVTGQKGFQLLQTFENFLRNLTNAQSYFIRYRFATNLQNPSSFKAQASILRHYYNDSSSIPTISSYKLVDAGDDTRSDEWNPEDSAKPKTGQAVLGITCGDLIVRPAGSVAKFREWSNIFETTSKLSGDHEFLGLLYQCSLWKNDANEKFIGSFTNLRTKNPILYVNTKYDPITPLLSAQNSSAGFIGSRLLVSTGTGHCSPTHPSSELNSAIRQYFVDASFPATEKIYNPDEPNPFITPPKDVTFAIKRKESTAAADLFKDTPAITRRQGTIPAGCVKKKPTPSS